MSPQQHSKFNRLPVPRSTVGGNPYVFRILAPGRHPLSYRQLRAQLDLALRWLEQAGVQPAHRIATFLRSGPDTAVPSLALMSRAALTPLNPDMAADELARYLYVLRPDALVVPRYLDTPGVDVARRCGVSIIRLKPSDTEPAGTFTLASDASAVLQEGKRHRNLGSRIALALHPSGTTAQPKVVPLIEINICTSAVDIARSLRLMSDDRCLDTMPLFHVHGLIRGLLPSMTAGASVICPPGLVATEFFGWMDELGPTSYAAVPTMHQAIVSRAPRHTDVVARRQLRVIRSCSSPLPKKVAQQLTAVFEAPIVEAYGMTETAHQLAVTRLGRRPGSGGVACEPELAIMGTDGQLLGENMTGGIVARGQSIVTGYENNPSANAAAFTSGWFYRGDQGHPDSDEFLHITGRIKELINRAGERITPREVEEALLSHTAVSEAVAFAVPHPTLGEEVGAAVALRSKQVGATEPRSHVASRLAAFKGPRPVVSRIDTEGPTGKRQRLAMPQLQGLNGQPRSAARAEPASRSIVRRRMADLWPCVLRIDAKEIEPEHSFFDVGGDSILAAQLVARMPGTFCVDFSLLNVFEHSTLAGFSRYVEEVRRDREHQSLSEPRKRCWSLVPIQKQGDRLPIFAIRGVMGDIATFAELSCELGSTQPFLGLQVRGEHQEPSARQHRRKREGRRGQWTC